MIVDGSATGSDRGIDQVTGIPVRNLWLLMFYASHLFEQAARGKVAVEDNPEDIPDLVAEILSRAVEKRLMRNLTPGYLPEKAVIGRVRGRIDLLTTERLQLLHCGKIACRFDNLTVNTPRNRFVRAALLTIARIVHRPDLAHRCRVIAASLTRLGVSADVPTRMEVDLERFNRHDVEDQIMVVAAHLVFDLMLPTEFSGKWSLPLPSRDIHWMRRLYEKAVGGFYEIVLPPDGWRVRMGQNRPARHAPAPRRQDTSERLRG